MENLQLIEERQKKKQEEAQKKEERKRKQEERARLKQEQKIASIIIAEILNFEETPLFWRTYCVYARGDLNVLL